MFLFTSKGRPQVGVCSLLSQPGALIRETAAELLLEGGEDGNFLGRLVLEAMAPSPLDCRRARAEWLRALCWPRAWPACRDSGP